ncbi:S41 family peptidase [Pinibacter soli]|uniref:S41 family peptidase n=1 Tax=Pinibacter soli TaxID=3044211 RepID=A0ABT6R700_9BACT|nr:S41 family peptidase [Pinibacter soli]MDI3318339.1 S41 family peptidase [Pinibacter soli]
MNAQNSSERDILLIRWINKFGSFKETKNNDEQFVDSKLRPDVEWITASNIFAELSQLLLRIKNAKRNNENYFTELEFGKGYPTFKNENSYAAVKFPDVGFRMLALYRYWNIIQYYFPYKNLIEEDWKNVLSEFIPKFINVQNELEYHLISLELIAKINDTHANIWGGNAVLGRYFGARIAAPELVFIDNKAVVKDFYDEKSEKETGLKKGDIITEVNDIKIDEIIAAKSNIMPASNHAAQLRDIAMKLFQTNDSLINIGYLRNGNADRKTLKTYPIREMNFYKKYLKKDSCFKRINPEIGYLHLGSIKSKYLPSIFETVKTTKGLIIDLRCYPSEFVVSALGQYLMPKETQFAKITEGSAEWPGLFTFKSPSTVGKTNKEYYKGKIIILINELTQSQAEYTTMAFRVAPNAKVVGSTTAGADGNVKQFYLPGGILTMISGQGIYYPDGGETQRIGIVPDVEVKPTIEGIKNGADEVLNKAIEIINK